MPDCPTSQQVDNVPSTHITGQTQHRFSSTHLKHLHPARQLTIRMGPLVELVGEGHKESQPAEKDEEVVARSNVLGVVHDQVVACEGQKGKHRHTVVSIALDDIMPCDGCRVYVMLAEWPDKCLHAMEQNGRSMITEIYTKIQLQVWVHRGTAN